MKRYREKGKTIDYSTPENKLILSLAKRGLSVWCITQEVNKRIGNLEMSQCQVYYRIRQSDIYLSNVRNGFTKESRFIIENAVIRLYPAKKAV